MNALTAQFNRRFPFGAEVLPQGNVSLRVWAPKHERVEVVRVAASGEILQSLVLKPDGDGCFSVAAPANWVDALYGFRLENEHRIVPDPCSRFQPLGPFGPSRIVNAQSFRWTDRCWPGVPATGQVIYEVHIGTFTGAGTWRAAMAQLADLANAGMTVLQIMPVSEFPGQFGWGYDGVFPFAPTRNYGTPDDFRQFVDAAHGHNLGVILDVVYNHWGPFERCLEHYSDKYHAVDRSEWGDAPNYDGEGSEFVREFIISNARYWIEEFHLDGLRLDATQAIRDKSPRHIIAEITAAARAAAPARRVVLLAENEPQEVRVLQPVEEGGWDCDWIYNDDFHHAAHVCATGSNPAYYSDFRGTAAELVTSIRHGFIFQGQHSHWQKKPRGTNVRGVEAHRFVSFLQNHDQIANQGAGERLHALTSPARLRAITALWLLSPHTPLFFQGQEFAATAPFQYFADFPGELGEGVTRGRNEFLSQFPALRTNEMQGALPRPCERGTFERCRINALERESHRAVFAMHCDLLALRRRISPHEASCDAAVLNHESLAIRYLTSNKEDWLVLANFGRDWEMRPVAEPLLAPLAGCAWKIEWHSHHPRYGGPGFEPHCNDSWKLAGDATVVLVSREAATEHSNEGCAP